MKERLPPHWRLYDGKRVKVQLQWEPADLWIGVFWRISRPRDFEGGSCCTSM